MSKPETKRNLLAAALRLGLLLALGYAGWRIYQRLPAGDAGDAAGAPPTTLRLILRRAVDDGALGADIDVQLYSVDLAAVQREFASERRPGVRYHDFLARRMQGRPPVTTRLDAAGQATVSVAPGRWWVHATLNGAEEITWRLPVNVAGREQTVELTPENAYTRTKSF
ncbi:MAG TPA: hypothetical protein VF546_23615 [Pyrinomonadaceae bacterium]